MTKTLTQLTMALIFVFGVLASPLGAVATGHDVPAAAAMAMDDACAHAMHQDRHMTGHDHGKPASSDGCCTTGCNCPLSHAPSTLVNTASTDPAVLTPHLAIFAPDRPVTLRAYLADTLKRPPKA